MSICRIFLTDDHNFSQMIQYLRRRQKWVSSVIVPHGSNVTECSASNKDRTLAEGTVCFLLEAVLAARAQLGFIAYLLIRSELFPSQFLKA